jgi:hypothetical protein
MHFLNEFNCQSVPNVIESGLLPENVVKHHFNESSNTFFYQVTEYVNPLLRVERGDLILSLLELARRGIFPNDIKKNNLGWKDSKLYILDYDQYIQLDSDLEIENSWKLIQSLNSLQLNSLGFPIYSVFGNIWNRYLTKREFTEYGQFKIEKTSRFKRQLSTRNRHNNYYRISTNLVFAPGVRDITSRADILNRYSFSQNDSVLDFGANLGLVSQHIERRVKVVHAFEIDEATASLGQTLMNINRSKVHFLDEFPQQKYSHLFLFSVIQHIQNLRSTAAKLDKLAKVILIENRMIESGKVLYSKNDWKQAESWNFSSRFELESFLLGLFPLKNSIRVLGESDKGRFIFEIS